MNLKVMFKKSKFNLNKKRHISSFYCFTFGVWLRGTELKHPILKVFIVGQEDLEKIDKIDVDLN